MTILELTLQKLSSAASQFLCASQVSLGALNWSSPRMHSLKKKTLLRTKKNSLSDYSSSFKIAQKAKRNITLYQKSNFGPKSRYLVKLGFLSKKVDLADCLQFQAFLDICCCLLICGQKMEFCNSVDKKRGKKMPFAYWRGKNEDWHVNCLWHLASADFFVSSFSSTMERRPPAPQQQSPYILFGWGYWGCSWPH